MSAIQVSQVLEAKGRTVAIVGPDDVVETASRRIDEMRRGLAVVCDEKSAAMGIISVIDINRAIARHGAKAPSMAVREVMNPDICVCGPSDTVEQALDTMLKRGIRHLPVVAEGQLRGIVNIQDLLEARFEEAQLGLDEMQRYVFGVGYR